MKIRHCPFMFCYDYDYDYDYVYVLLCFVLFCFVRSFPDCKQFSILVTRYQEGSFLKEREQIFGRRSCMNGKEIKPWKACKCV